MALQNPTIDPPRFALPTRLYSGTSTMPSTSPSPSPSRSTSPSRHLRNFSHSYDPLARDLSPTRTLKAFDSTPDRAGSKSEAALIRLVEQASTHERAFGIRIAQICKDIRAWHVELQNWPWGDSFHPPTGASDAPEGPYWGSLRQNQVIAYEQRITEIREALFDQDVDSLKDYVLAQHTTSGSTSYEHLGDFTALITATILRALPNLARLDRLLNTWMIRLAVLRKIPAFLSGLDQAKIELDKAWSDMGSQLESNTDALSLRKTFQSLQESLESRMGKMGGRLDSMLDDLEGKEETLPDAWIDSFEALEASYTAWLTETERRINARLLHANERPVVKSVPANITTREVVSATPESSESDREQIEPSHGAPELLEPPPLTAIHQSFQDAESPILGTSSSAFLPDVDEASDLESDSASSALDRARQMTASASPVVSRTTSIQRLGTPPSSSPLNASMYRQMPYQTADSSGVNDDASRPSSAMSSRLSAPFTQPELPPTTINVRARAAMVNGGLETKQKLQKSASPVRPFEHASSAFTKLFNKANAVDQQSRSSSVSSMSSVRQGRGLGIKSHEGFRRFHRASSLTSPKKTTDENRQRSATVSPHIVQSSPLLPGQSYSPEQNSTTFNSSPPIQQDPYRTDSSRPGSSSAFITPDIQQGFFPSSDGSRFTMDTTMDTLWTSPESPEFPDNWPLPSVTVVGDEITTPRNPVDSNIFEQMFVDSLPGTPRDVDQKSRRMSQEGDPFEKVLLTDEFMFGERARRRSLSNSSSSSALLRHKHLKKASTNSLPFEPISELPTPASFEATPELHDASAAGYFVAKKVKATSPEFVQPPNCKRSVSLNRPSSQFDTRQDTASDSGSVLVDADAPIRESLDDPDSDYEIIPERRPPTMIKRASVASIENYSRSEITTIDMSSGQRRASSLPRWSFGRHSQVSSPEPMPQSVSPQDVSPLVPPPTLRSDTERSYAADMLGASKPVPLSLNVPKRRLVVETEPSPSPTGSQIKTPVANSFKKKHARKESGDEQLDRHVSRVLSALPSKITFKPSGSGPSPPNPSSTTSTPTNSLRGRPTLSTKITTRTGLTLSAAQPTSTKKPSAVNNSTSNDADVKLYHLTQEGKEQPIKLFVRLVGDGERVMVRVGGGWADLGEYLRHYAEHHSHRTFSEGKVEVASAGTSNGGGIRGAKTRSTLSRPNSVMSGRPESSLSFRTHRSSFGASTSTNATLIPQEEEEEMEFSPFSSSRNIDVNNHQAFSTPAGSTKSSSRPSTADTSYMHNASPSSWSGKEIGLAGPKGKQSNGLDEQKAKWVEEMIGRAKQASTEKKRFEDRIGGAGGGGGSGGSVGNGWGDMGRVGGTRRMIFKGKNGGGGGDN